MRILITGAAGFVGSHLVRAALAHGHDVVAAVRSRAGAAPFDASRLQVVEADLADGRAMHRLAADAKPDLAVHLAWSIGVDYADSVDNLSCAAGSLALLQGLLHAECPRIVFVGSHLELAPSERDLTEHDPVAPRGLYAVSKDAVHRIARTAVARTAAAFVWVRLFNLYGPGQAEWALVPAIIRHLLDGRRCPMTHGEQMRGLLHVRDAAGALLAIGESTIAGVVHVGSDEAVSVRALALRIAERLGHAELLDFGARAPSPHDAPRVVAAIARLRDEVGFRPQVGLDDGLREAIDWWRAQ